MPCCIAKGKGGSSGFVLGISPPPNSCIFFCLFVLGFADKVAAFTKSL